MLITERINEEIFGYIEWLDKYDNAQTQQDLDNIFHTYSEFIESLLIENLNKTKTYFEQVVDQPIYMSDDYINLRRFLIYWYASFKTMMDTNKHLSNIDVINKNLMLESLGYTLSNLTGDYINKSILQNLSNMYDIKGSPLVLQQVFSLLRINNFNIYEYWLYNYDGTLKFVPFAITDTGFNSLLQNFTMFSIPYNNPVVNADPHWYYTEQEILLADANESSFNLPSLTPYIGVFSPNDWVRLSRLVMSYISRVITDQYEKLKNDNEYPEQIYYVDLLNQNLSTLETVLSFSYLYNIYYNRVSTESRQLLNLFIQHSNLSDYDVYYSDINFINEFNRLRTRPSSRAEQKQMIEEYKLKFLMKDKEIVWTHADNVLFLMQYYPELKQKLDDMLNNNLAYDLMQQLLDVLTYIIRVEKGIPTFDFSYVLHDFVNENREVLLEILNFFKPWQARILELAEYFIIDDKPGNYLIVEDKYIDEIQEQFVEEYLAVFTDNIINEPQEIIEDKVFYIEAYLEDITHRIDDNFNLINYDDFRDLIEETIADNNTFNYNSKIKKMTITHKEFERVRINSDYLFDITYKEKDYYYEIKDQVIINVEDI